MKTVDRGHDDVSLNALLNLDRYEKRAHALARHALSNGGKTKIGRTKPKEKSKLLQAQSTN